MSQVRMSRRRKHLSFIQYQQERSVGSIEATQQLRERSACDAGLLSKLGFKRAFGDSRNSRRSFYLFQRSLQLLDQAREPARRAGASERTDQGATRMFTCIPQIQVRSKES